MEPEFKASRFNIEIRKNGSDYLYNSFSKACVKVLDDKKTLVYEALNAPNTLAGKTAEYQADLLKNGFVVKHGADEIAQVHYMYMRNYFSSSVLNLVLLPTMACNLACPYCFEEGHKEIPSRSDYFPALRAFAEKNFLGRKLVQVSLFGGEPLLKSAELIEYLSFCVDLSRKYGFQFLSSIVTNGVLMNEKISEALIDSGCSSLQVTIDGVKATHDSLRVGKTKTPTYDVIFENFQRAITIALSRSKKLHFILRINLYNQTQDAVTATLDTIEPSLRPHVQVLFRPVYSTKCFNSINSDTAETLTRYYDVAKGMGYQIVQNSYLLQQCEASGDEAFFYVTPDLKAWKCVADMTYDGACFGEIGGSGDLVVNREKMSQWFKHSDPFLDEKCLACKKLPECYGGCILSKAKKGTRKCKTDDLLILPNIYA